MLCATRQDTCSTGGCMFFTSAFLRLCRHPRDQPSFWCMNPGASDPNPVARASRLAGHSALCAPAVCAHAGLVSHRGLQTALSAATRKCGTLPQPRADTEFLHRRLAEQARRVHSAPACCFADWHRELRQHLAQQRASATPLAYSILAGGAPPGMQA